jgi:hypothetical protein
MRAVSHSSTESAVSKRDHSAQITAIRIYDHILPTELSENMQEYDKSNKAQRKHEDCRRATARNQNNVILKQLLYAALKY